jgi:hypothetical protein
MTHAADLALGNTPQHPVVPPTNGPGTLVITVLTVFSLPLWLAVAFQIVFIAPRFEKLFADFKMKIPLATELVIFDGWWIAPACLVAALLLCVARQSRWTGLILLVVLPLVINVLIITSLYLPYAALVEGLGGNAPKF